MWQLCIVLALSWRIHAIDVEHLSASNFELSLQRGFAAVLFHDKSSASTELFDAWESAAGMIESLHDDALMGAVDGTDPGLKEFIDAYAIVLPSIRVFRRSVIGEYRGPSRGDSAKEIAEYIQADALVSTPPRQPDSILLASFLPFSLLSFHTALGQDFGGQSRAATGSTREGPHAQGGGHL